MVDLNVIDIGDKKIEQCKISLCQIHCPSESESTKAFRFRSPKHQEKKILECLTSIKDSKVVIFPEFSIPERTLQKLTDKAKEKQVYIIGGMEYDRWLRNICIVIPPEGQCYRMAKLNPSKYEEKYLQKHSLEMRRGEYINCFINSGFGDFAILICYDYTSQNLIQELRGKIDILFVIANNPDVATFSQKALSDCFTNYCYIVVCNNARYGGSGVYGPLDYIKNNIIDKRLCELPNGEQLKIVEVNVKKLRKAISLKKGLKTKNGSRFKTLPADFKRKKLIPSKPQLEYTLLDWPEPFDQDCVIIIGSAIRRAIWQLTAPKKTLQKYKEIDKRFYEELEHYLPGKNKYYMARPSDCAFLPQLVARLLNSPRGGKAPRVYEDEWVIEGDEEHPCLKAHNIISVGTAEVNKVSEKINEELKKDGHIYFAEKKRPFKLFDEYINREIWDRKAQQRAGVIGLTRNPFNKDKLALLCGGIRDIGTAAAMKFLAENDGEAFRCHRYGVTVFAIDIDKPSNFSRGPVGKVLKISDNEIRKYLEEI